jgi:Skp family chaperone for outer membrane proteins
MNTRERCIVYSVLAMLALSQALVLLSTGAGSQSWASARALFEEIGPATAVRLVDEDNSSAKEVVLRNEEGRLRFGDSAHSAAYSVGFVHVGKALGQLMESESMKDARARLDEELNEKDEQFRSRMQAFEEEHRDMKPDDPNVDDVRNQYRGLLEEFQRWQMEKMGQREKLFAEQVEQAYRDVVAAVDVVADRSNVDIVYRFIPTEDEFEATSPAAAYDAIRARVAIKYPDGLDLTDPVLEELDLDFD